MVVFLVIITILLFIASDYLIHRKEKIDSQTKPLTLQPNKISKAIPSGVFLQPTLTWSKILDDGSLAIGVHPFLLDLIDKPSEIEVLHSEKVVNKGDTIAVIRKGDKTLHIKSPVAGSLICNKMNTVEYSNWENLCQNCLCIMKPTNISEQIRFWFIGNEAKLWMKKKYQQIQEYLQKCSPKNGIELDIGSDKDIPIGILQHFDAIVWQNFEKKFLTYA